MADKRIDELTAATTIGSDDMLVMEQSGEAKSVTGALLKSYATADVLSAAAETLPAGSSAAASYASTTKTLTIGVPVGADGKSVGSVSRTSGTGAPGTTDTYTIYDSTGAAIGTFGVYNGTDGTGSGDMSRSIYDTANRNTDIFEYVDGLVGDVEEALEALL